MDVQVRYTNLLSFISRYQGFEVFSAGITNPMGRTTSGKSIDFPVSA